MLNAPLLKHSRARSPLHTERAARAGRAAAEQLPLRVPFVELAREAAAFGGGKGLVVPVLRHAERMGFAEIEKRIRDFGARARSGDLALDELQGGTFTITNGGIYGSMMSTPILNPPQSAILGMHKIEKRPVVINDKIEIRSMMYLALSYDHRVIDGAEAVSFLEYIRKCIDDPADYLIDLF